jgi:hypothetical protein
MTDLRTANTPSVGSSAGIPVESSLRALHAFDWRAIVPGLLFMLAVLVVGGLVLSPQGALLVVGPISLFAMPVLASLADFVVPLFAGQQRRWLVAVIILAAILGGAIVLTVLAQGIVGHIDLVGIFSADPRTAASHLSAFPFTIPLGGVLFVAYLEVAIVSGVPMITKNRLRDGAIAFLGCVIVALILYETLANWNAIPAPARAVLGIRNPGGPIDALDLAGIVISIAIWQVLYLFFGGGPLSAVPGRWPRIVVSNAVVIGMGLATYWLLHYPLQASVPQIAVVAAMEVVGILVVGILFGRPAAGPPGTVSPLQRLIRFCLAVLVSVLTFLTLRWLGMLLQSTWAVGSLELWIAISGLNLLGGSIFLYCRILRPLLDPHIES